MLIGLFWSHRTNTNRDAKPAITRNFSMHDQLGKEEADVSWGAVSKDGEDGDGIVTRPRRGSGDVILESMLFKDDAKEIGVVEVCVCVLTAFTRYHKRNER